MAAVWVLAGPARSEATEWFVAPGGTGTGTSAAPFGRIQDALNAAQPGDTVSVLAGTYAERIATARAGADGNRITLRAAGAPRSVLVTASGRVLTVNHAYFAVEGLVFDGQYGLDDTIRVSGNGHAFLLRHSEVRRATRDLIDMGSPQGVVIEHCLVHHALNAAGGRTDAHGIVAGAVRDLVIRDTEIHTFSGDGVQVDPGRAAPGWTNVTIERAHIWLAPLPAPENGFPAGALTGENAVDTKASASLPRATLVIRDTIASGFGSKTAAGNNWAAFNLKEHVDVTVDRVTVFDSEIAFRLRGATTGGAWVAISNAVVHDVLTAFRYEDNIQNLRIWNSTVGRGVTRVFQAASSNASGLDVRNLLVLAGGLPAEAGGSASNLAVGSSAFVNAAAHDYALAAGSAAVDAGITLSQVGRDRAGTARPQGPAYDVGAYEWNGGAGTNAPPTVAMTSPADGTELTAPATVTLSAAADDTDGTIVEVGFYADGALIERDTTRPFSVVRTDVAAEQYALQAVAVDDFGASTASAAVRLTVLAAAPSLSLTTRGYKVKGAQRVDVSWAPSGPGKVDIYRDGAKVATTTHDGAYTDALNRRGGGSYTYQVCLAGSNVGCSNESTVAF